MVASPHRFARSLAAVLVLCSMTIASPLVTAETSGGRFQAGRAGFAVRFKDVVSDLAIMGVYLLPGEVITLEAVGAGDCYSGLESGAAPPGDLRLDSASWAAWQEFQLEASSGTVVYHEANKWRWQAPDDAGLYPIAIRRIPAPCGAEPDSIGLNVFVMVPYTMIRDESLLGYRIGRYPNPSPRRLPRRTRPRGFVAVTEGNAGTMLSPHFRLEQFLCKQRGGYPKFVVLSERLILKLELILERMNQKGYVCQTFHVMSGYRTPHYNKILGNVSGSLHLWGWAADIFIDESPRDGVMDDLNGDGAINVRDAALLYDAIDEMFVEPSYLPLAGGLAKYKKTRSHGPFVHVDVRGRRARW